MELKANLRSGESFTPVANNLQKYGCKEVIDPVDGIRKRRSRRGKQWTLIMNVALIYIRLIFALMYFLETKKPDYFQSPVTPPSPEEHRPLGE